MDSERRVLLLLAAMVQRLHWADDGSIAKVPRDRCHGSTFVDHGRCLRWNARGYASLLRGWCGCEEDGSWSRQLRQRGNVQCHWNRQKWATSIGSHGNREVPMTKGIYGEASWGAAPRQGLDHAAVKSLSIGYVRWRSHCEESHEDRVARCGQQLCFDQILLKSILTQNNKTPVLLQFVASFSLLFRFNSLKIKYLRLCPIYQILPILTFLFA